MGLMLKPLLFLGGRTLPKSPNSLVQTARWYLWLRISRASRIKVSFGNMDIKPKPAEFQADR